MTQDYIHRINGYLIKEHSFKIPNEFLNKKGDIISFIDIEELFLDEFKLSSVSQDISDLLKLNNDILSNFKYKTELKTLGLGFAKDSLKGRGPSKPESKILISFFKDSSKVENESKFVIAKAANDPRLNRISYDKVTDFILILKEKEWEQITIKLLDIAISDLNLPFSSSEAIEFMTKDKKDTFPFLIPLEITERLLPDLGEEFYLSVVVAFVNLPKNSELKHRFEGIHEYTKDLNGKTIRNKTYLSEVKELLKGNEDFKNTLFDTSKKTIEDINIKMKDINDINDLKEFKKSYELEFALRNKTFRKKIGIKTKRSTYVDIDDMNEIINFYFANDKILYFSSMRERNTINKINHISNSEKDTNIFLFKLSNSTSITRDEFKDKERISLLTLNDPWNIIT